MEAELPTALGPLHLRPERLDDAAFLYALFREHAGGALAAAALPAPTVEQLVQMQHRGQTRAYRADFPHARFQVVERGGEPVGRLVEADEPGGVYIVDLAVSAQRQRSGIGAALIGHLQARQGPLGGAVRALVSVANQPSRSLFHRMGFIESESPGASDLHLVWTSPPGVRCA